MNERNIPWRAEFKAAGEDPGPLTPNEEALVPRLMEENRQFLHAHPFRQAQRTRPQSVVTLWSAPLLAAAALLIAIPLGGPLVTPGDGTERVKGPGDPRLVVYRQNAQGSERLANGARVRPRDVLQAAYQVSRPVEGAILSVDGRGTVTIHLADGQRSVRLVSGGEQSLAAGYELDKAPRYEVFFLFTSDRPFALDPLQRILASTPWESLKAGAFGPEVHFVTVAFPKEEGQ